ncbi:MAG: polysaccharide biosynthesis protein, partial [Gemmatimonadetes bacterium]|nr:polysaccharide biosynthesis protein [Gemmatimonadota bacterium]
ITHPEMRRYFMTIPEAVQLVLQAFVMGTPGAVYCLDMGEPVRIVDLARDLIQLASDEADHPVQIQFTGARPGEKLYEEMFFGSEDAAPTEHPKVLQARHATLRPNAADEIASLVEKLGPGAPEQELLNDIRHLVEDFRRELVPPDAGMDKDSDSSPQAA